MEYVKKAIREMTEELNTTSIINILMGQKSSQEDYIIYDKKSDDCENIAENYAMDFTSIGSSGNEDF